MNPKALRCAVLTCCLPLFGIAFGAGCNWMTSGGPKQLRQGIVVKCNQPKATLYIDERIVGTLGRPEGLRVGLAPGTYRMAVQLPGYFPRYLDLKVKEDRYQRITVQLRQELD